MTQWEIWDQLMAEDEERRLRIARCQVAIEKRKAAEQVARKKMIQSHRAAMPKLRAGEGKIIRTAAGYITIIYYSKADIERVARLTPWLLPELLRELEDNKNEATYFEAV